MVNWLNKIVACLNDHDWQIMQAMKDVNIVLSSENHWAVEKKTQTNVFLLRI